MYYFILNILIIVSIYHLVLSIKLNSSLRLQVDCHSILELLYFYFSWFYFSFLFSFFDFLDNEEAFDHFILSYYHLIQ